MKKIICFSALFILSVLTGCATGYQSAGFGGFGYTEMALSKNSYVVSFKGNGVTSVDTVQSYLLRRCAELTLRKGYRYFVIMDGKTSVDSAVIETPTTINSTGTASYNGYGQGNTNYYGNRAYSNFNTSLSGYSNSQTTINPGSQYQIDKYTSRAIIQMFKSNKNLLQALDAEIILSNFKNENTV